MAGAEIDRLMAMLARLPGLGPRSARRAALYLLKKRDTALEPLIAAMSEVAGTVRRCSICGNLDSGDPCAVCSDPRREGGVICVVEGVEDLWALERTGAFSGRYHVLGGLLSPLDGVGPDDLALCALIARAAAEDVKEVILALAATVDGQATAHYVTDQLRGCAVAVSGLAHGVPVGGELDYLDDGTLSQALRARRPV